MKIDIMFEFVIEIENIIIYNIIDQIYFFIFDFLACKIYKRCSVVTKKKQ